MRNLSLKQTIVVIVFVAALLITLVGGIIRIDAARSAPVLLHSTHALAWYCPAPPVTC